MRTTRENLLPALAAAAMLFCSACFAPRPAARLTGEPSIERALDLLKTIPDAAQLMDFLRKNPVTFRYSRTSGDCTAFSLKTGLIFLPRALKENDALLAAALARAAYVHRLSVLSGLKDVLAEEEEAAALFQARISLRIGMMSDDLKGRAASKEMRSGLCAYLLEGSGAAMLSARGNALSDRPECGRPMDTLRDRRLWLEDVRAVIDDRASFFQLMKERDLARVRKGELTAGEAARNDADLRALPTYELYRRQRALYDSETEILSELEGLYRSAVKSDALWRASNQALIDAARREFSFCTLP